MQTSPSSSQMTRRPFVTGLLLSSIALYAHTLPHEDDDISRLSSVADRGKRVSYGTFTVPSRSENNGMLRFKDDVDPPCSDCVITGMSANLEYLNGTTADATNGMWMHHIVFSNRANSDGVCGDKKSGQRFYGAGNDRSPLDLTNGGKSTVGYYLGEDDKFLISVELMNMHHYSQDVALTASFEYVEAPNYSDYQLGTPYWLDIAGCDKSDRPAAKDSRFTYSSPRTRLDFYEQGRIIYISNHVHDGGVLLEVRKNGKIICSAIPQYSANKGVDDNAHISYIPSCSDAGQIASSDEFDVTASYDTFKYPLMVNEDGSFEPIMGIALAYVVKGAPTGTSRNGGFEVAITLTVMVTVVLLAAWCVLYLREEHSGWSRWFLRKQKYQSLGREEQD